MKNFVISLVLFPCMNIEFRILTLQKYIRTRQCPKMSVITLSFYCLIIIIWAYEEFHVCQLKRWNDPFQHGWVSREALVAVVIVNSRILRGSLGCASPGECVLFRRHFAPARFRVLGRTITNGR
jgi:hypothetical protein